MAQPVDVCTVIGADLRRYGRTTSAGGTTTVATPAPPSAATALTEAADKRQGPTAPAQASALSSALPGTSQAVATDPHMAGHSHQVGTVAITTADFTAAM